MQKRINITYHFHDGDGNAPDEGHVRRGLEEIVGLLAILPDELSHAERKAVNAMTEGFTIDQLRRFVIVVTQSILSRVERAKAMPNSEHRNAILKDVEQISNRWLSINKDLIQFISDAESVLITGMEESRSDRQLADQAGRHAEQNQNTH